MPHPTLDQGSQTFGCGTSRLHCPLRHAWENVREAPFHREALEGSKHRFTASLSHEGRWQCLGTTSCRLSEVNDSVRNLCWLVRYFKRNAVPLERLLWPMLVAVGDGNHFVGHALHRAQKGKSWSERTTGGDWWMSHHGQSGTLRGGRVCQLSRSKESGSSFNPLSGQIVCGRDFVCHPRE